MSFLHEWKKGGQGEPWAFGRGRKAMKEVSRERHWPRAKLKVKGSMKDTPRRTRWYHIHLGTSVGNTAWSGPQNLLSGFGRGFSLSTLEILSPQILPSFSANTPRKLEERIEVSQVLAQRLAQELRRYLLNTWIKYLQRVPVQLSLGESRIAWSLEHAARALVPVK